MEILDEALALLRRTPLGLLFLYYLGAGPFCLGLIYFVFDMTQSANAESHLASGALGLTALYFWMKTCQAVFCRRLLARLEGEDAEPWTAQRWANTAILQAIYAGSFMLVYPTAIVITIPFAWVNAFYHSISIVATSTKSTLRSSFAEASSLSALWPKQNHLVIGIQLLALLFLFLNLAVFLSMMPELLSMLFGITTVFDENGSAWQNSSFYLDVSVFCFLFLNPVSKAVYVLRCFYGRARLNGADLKAEMRLQNRARQEQAPARVLATLAVLAVVVLATPARADDAATPAPAPPVSNVLVPAVTPPPAAAPLNHAIDATLQKDEFAWRLPRPAAAAPQDGLLARVIHSIEKFIWHLMEKLGKAIAKFLKWLLDHGHKHDLSNPGPSLLEAVPWRLIFVLLALVVVVFLAILLARHFQRRGAMPAAKLQAAPVRTVDLEAEDLRADELPEDSWLALAQELIAKGETRLALRALYLATLSILARNELIRLGPAKSNRDYLTELTRRLRGNAEAVPFFRESIHLFEASWYGTHAVTSAILEKMQANHQSVRSHAAT
jgi:hypothetical protein